MFICGSSTAGLRDSRQADQPDLPVHGRGLHGERAMISMPTNSSAAVCPVYPNEPVSISIVKDPSKITVSPSSGINVGDLVTVSAIGSDMGSEIQLNVGGQFLKIHTSCSQPLAAGDIFGSLELLQFNGQGSGAKVTYSYTVTNVGQTDAEVTSVSDNELGLLFEGSERAGTRSNIRA